MIDKRVLKELQEQGLPWTIDQGSRHLKLRVCGKFVGILPLGNGSQKGRATRNVVSQIRRAAAGFREQSTIN